MKILCKLYFHKCGVVKTFSYTARCVKCVRCRKYFAMNDKTKSFLPWDGEFSELYDWSPHAYDY